MEGCSRPAGSASAWDFISLRTSCRRVLMYFSFDLIFFFFRIKARRVVADGGKENRCILIRPGSTPYKSFLLVICGSLTGGKRPRPTATAGEREKDWAGCVRVQSKTKEAFYYLMRPESHERTRWHGEEGGRKHGTHTLSFCCLMDLKEIQENLEVMQQRFQLQPHQVTLDDLQSLSAI